MHRPIMFAVIPTVLALAIAIGVAQTPPSAQRYVGPAIETPRVTCDRWPDNYDAKSWIEDVWRLENAQTGEQKALALYKWVRLQQHWGDQCFDGTRGKSMCECDAIKKINVFPYGECSDFGVTAAALGHAGGLKTMEAHVPEHTQLDIFYKDADGQERWHRFDPFWGIVVYDKTGSHIATWEEIKADPNIAIKPSKTVLPWGDRSTDRQRFAAKAMSQPERRVRPSVYTMDKPLYAGESYLLSWNLITGLAFRNNNPQARDVMTNWGLQRYRYADGDFTRLAYGHELILPYAGRMGNDVQIRQSHGALLFTPLMNDRFTDSLCAPAVNVAVGGEGKTLHPAKAGKPAELIYLVQTPYVIVDSQLAGNFLLGEGGKAKVSIALADWRERDFTLDQVIPDKPHWKVVWESGSGPGRRNMRLLENDLCLRGEYKFLVKVEMSAAKDAAAVETSGLVFTVRFQEGVMALPRLLPGRNVIRLTGGPVKPGYQLCATYTWDDPDGQGHTQALRAEHLPCEFEIKAAGTQPADVVTRGVLLQAVHKTDKLTTQPADQKD